jgi:cardiolipin synthase
MATKTETCTQPAAAEGLPRLDVAGNRLNLISGGQERLAALLDLIDSADRRLCLFYYIFSNDEAGRQVLDALIEARNRDVAVTLIVDAFGTALTPDSFFEPLVEAGARFGRFGAKRTTRYLIRNHQKMAIADNKRALIGGFNCEQGYFIFPDNCDGWCDLGLDVRGPLAADLQRWYDRMAAWTLGTRQTFRQLRALVRRWQPGEDKAIWLMGGPTRRLNGWAARIKSDLEQARRLDMVAAYFSPGKGMMRRLKRVASSGAARIVLAAKSDNSATISASRHLYARLLKAGAGLFEYQPCKLHMKLYVMDDIVFIGSANFDRRSLFLNLEVMLRVEDAAFADQCRALIDAMARDSHAIDQAAYGAMRGPLSSLRWWFAYQVVSVLDYTVTRRLNFRRENRN